LLAARSNALYNATGSRMSKDSEREPPSAGALGFMLVALVVGFAVLGYFVDRWLHTGPWIMVGGVFVGAGLGFLYLVLILFAGQPRRGRKGGCSDPGEGPGEGSS
jgi:F0F1-type ATP synthase assembly protein I